MYPQTRNRLCADSDDASRREASRESAGEVTLAISAELGQVAHTTGLVSDIRESSEASSDNDDEDRNATDDNGLNVICSPCGEAAMQMVTMCYVGCVRKQSYGG